MQFRALHSWLVDRKHLSPDEEAPPPPVEAVPEEYRAGALACAWNVLVTVMSLSHLISRSQRSSRWFWIFSASGNASCPEFWFYCFYVLGPWLLLRLP